MYPTVLGLDVEQDYPDLVRDGDGLVQEDRDNVAHMVADALALCITAQGQVLLHLAQFVHVALRKDVMSI